MRHHRVWLALGAAFLMVGSSGCNADPQLDESAADPGAAVIPAPPARSVNAFCAVHDEHKLHYLAAFDSANQSMDRGDMLSGVLQAGVAIGDLNTMWKKLAKAAPEEIQVDTEILAEGWETQADLAGDILDNPLKGLSSALVSSFKLAGPIQRVDEYVRTHCDTR